MTESPDMARIVRQALAEDVGSGDATSLSTLPPGLQIRAAIVAKASGVIAGLAVAAEVFAQLDPAVVMQLLIDDGSVVDAGDRIAEISGPAVAVLAGERTALNFLQRMSGIATTTRAYVARVRGTGVVILDTRKTAPGLRMLDKEAVRAGGGQNHRMGLFDMVLVKDNHIDACGSITKAVAQVRSGPYATLPLEVECRTAADVVEATALAPERILLDNMTVTQVRECVGLVAGRVPLEVSGNVSLENLRSYAETGVTWISVGALTHSVRALDLSLQLI
ncbi:MAG TPA: carboxylating nicotinate-nucleotide diphosphorylase [Vicinamibacterales bacterium]|nr:carboxylating nicotinate-nucleotide diphosphorylase [Vicinamibacterales bacterium]